MFTLGEPGLRPATTSDKTPVKLLTNVEKLQLLTKAERMGLLSAAERLGLLSKAEKLGALLAATDPGMPSALLALALLLLAAGPAVVYLVPEELARQLPLQAVAVPPPQPCLPRSSADAAMTALPPIISSRFTLVKLVDVRKEV